MAFNYLLIWAIFIVLWTPRTYHLNFSIGYSGWFLICVVVVFAAVQYYGHDRKQALQISRIYFRFVIDRTFESELLAATGMGFILLFVILQFNQSIISIYLWNHIAIMAVLYYYVRHASARTPARSPRQTQSRVSVYA